MTPRTRLVNTIRWLCHLLVAFALLTSRLHGTSQTATATAPPQVSSQTQQEESPIIKARQQEMQGKLFTLTGDVEIHYQGLILTADQVTYDRESGESTATGHVVLVGGQHDERVEATHGTYNVKDDVGRFYDAVGSIGLRPRGQRMTLTSPNPFMFRGAIVDKTGPSHYIVHHGSVTVCDGDTPAWSFQAQRAVVELGEDATLYHATFRLRNVPMFYLPFVSHSTESIGRQTGFLIPTIGQSSSRGTTIGDGFYWAINRNSDMTIGADYFSHRGWAQHGDFRIRTGDDSFLEARYFGVLDRGFGPARIDQGGEEVTIAGQGQLPMGFRGVIDADYLSSLVFRQAFNENFAEAVNAEVKSNAFASNSWDGLGLNLSAGRYQNFQSTAHGDLVTILHAPSFEASSVDRQIGPTPFYWGFETAVEGVSRTEPNFATDPLVGRFDLTPRISAPVLIHGWTLRPEVTLRDTFYTQRVEPNGSLGVPIAANVNRRGLGTSLEVRPPALARIFERQMWGRTWKHTVEPRLTYNYVNGVDNFSNVIRFDARDIFSDTNEVEYAITNRIYAKRSADSASCATEGEPQPEEPSEAQFGQEPSQPASTCEKAGSVREIVTWELAQKAFFNPGFGGAVVDGRRNVLTTTADFTGIAFLTEPRTLSPLISRLRVHTSDNSEVQWNLDYDFKKGRINSSTVLASWHIGEIFFGGSQAFLHVPGEIFVTNPIPGPDRFNQFRVLAGYGHPNKRGISFAANLGVDANFNFLQYSTAQTSYNWDCIGMSVEYRRLALGSVRNENQFRFSLSLANIGTFGTLRRQERLF